MGKILDKRIPERIASMIFMAFKTKTCLKFENQRDNG
jgi:hypothetical protein